MKKMKYVVAIAMAALFGITALISVPLFSAAEEVVCPNHTEHDASCGYMEAAEGRSCTHTCELCNPPEARTLAASVNVKIDSFEKYNPVYDTVVKVGTAEDRLMLPASVRAVARLDDVVNSSGFVSAEPKVDMSDGTEQYDYYWYGYVRAEDGSNFYTIYYANNTEAYRTYGALNDAEEPCFFACDAAGRITGRVIDIPVTWSGSYDKDVVGEYTLTADIGEYRFDGPLPTALVIVEEAAENTDAHTQIESVAAECTCDVHKSEYTSAHDATCPYYHADCNCEYGKNEASGLHDPNCPWYAKMCTCGAETGKPHEADCPLYVAPEPDCSCGIDAGRPSWEHDEACPCFGPMECICCVQEEITDYNSETGETYTEMVSGDYSHIHDPNNRDCLLYKKDTVNITKADGSISVVAKEELQFFLDRGATASAETAAETDSLELLSINGGGGAIDVAGDAIMTAGSPTSGNANYVASYASFGSKNIPGTWLDYLNTIWMNKAFNKFAWTQAGDTGSYNNWMYGYDSGTGTMDGIILANSTSGTVLTNRLCRPSPVGGVWTVYSAEQFRYAITNFADGNTIRLGSNLNMNGMNINWTTTTSITGRKFILDGDNYTLYNLSFYRPDALSSSGPAKMGFLYRVDCNSEIFDLHFVTSKSVLLNASMHMFAYNGYRNYRYSMTNVSMRDSMVYMLTGSVQPLHDEGGTSYQCYTENCYFYGQDHVCGYARISYDANDPRYPTFTCKIENGYSVDCLLVGYGCHSGSFTSCGGSSGNGAPISNCFAANEVYGALAVGGFMSQNSIVLQNSYCTGKIEGYSYVGGLHGSANSGINLPATTSNCYSTALIGMRTQGENLGGLSGGTIPSARGVAAFSDCYAAGEVGNYDTNMDAPADTGGIIGGCDYIQFVSNANCYYDKQTTAMREWVSGASTALRGATGVLTTTTVKGGFGLADGDPVAAGATSGFTGFSDNSMWVYSAGHYPQLAVFANATAADWATQDRADLVKAYSAASTATVFLDTWDTGFDWNDTGVRTAAETSYARTLASTGESDHKGYEYTYDTVREIVTDFSVTADADYLHMIPGGAPMDLNNDGVSDGNAMEIGSGRSTIKAPGMDWFRIQQSVNGKIGYRPIRLISYMNVAAGADQTVYSGEIYNHRADVALTMMDTITDDLVVGFDDTKIWSTADTQGYPNSDCYYKVTTNPTAFAVSNDAWLYTEIWTVQKAAGYTLKPGETVDNGYVRDAAGEYVLDKSVKVTGTGTLAPDGSGTYTIDQQKWNGDFAIYPDTSLGSKYVISYYWMLSDGRYRTDNKVISVNPGKYTVKMDVYNQSTGSANNAALYLGAAADNGINVDYTLSAATIGNYATPVGEEIPYTANMTAAWKAENANTALGSIKVVLKDSNNNVVGTATVANPGEGTDVTIPIKYHYITTEYDSVQMRNREVTRQLTVDVAYTIEKNASDEYFLRFNKLKNAPTDEESAALTGGTDAGVAASGLDETGASVNTDKIYINDTMFNTEITLYILDQTKITVKKVVGNYSAELAAQPFFITLAGDANAQLSLKHNETGTVMTLNPAGAMTFYVREALPMEYTLKDISIVNNGAGTAPSCTLTTDADGTLRGAAITAYPGNEIVITVTNDFRHEGFFKASDWAKNQFGLIP